MRPNPGAMFMPNGSDYYRACLKFHLGTDVEPEELHELGKREVCDS